MEKYQKNALILFAGLTAILVIFTAIVLGWHYFKKPAPGLLVPLTPEEMAKKSAEIGVLNEFQQCQREGSYKNILPSLAGVRDIYYLTADIFGAKEPDKCNDFKDSLTQVACLKFYYLYFALLEKNISYCDKINTIAPIEIVGQNKPATEYDWLTSNSCKAIARSDESICKNLSGPQRIGCLSLIIKDELGDAICDEIREDINMADYFCKFTEGDEGEIKSCGIKPQVVAREKCYASHYIVKALLTQDRSFCDKIIDESTRYVQMACYVLLDLPNYEKIISDFYAKNACIEKYATFLADIHNDKSWCEKIPLKDSENKMLYSQCMENTSPILPKTPPIPPQPTSTSASTSTL